LTIRIIPVCLSPAAAAVLLILNMPPSLRAEAHRTMPTLIAACERVVVAVAIATPW